MATATYPPPPPYYKLYKDYLQNPKSAPEPPPPIQGTYMLYGATYTTDDVLPSLEEQGVRQLYPQGPNIDFKKELKALNRELQLHLLELADILIERPSQYARRVEDISLIFKNLHHLLNSLRPHQEARRGTETSEGGTWNIGRTIALIQLSMDKSRRTESPLNDLCVQMKSLALLYAQPSTCRTQQTLAVVFGGNTFGQI